MAVEARHAHYTLDEYLRLEVACRLEVEALYRD
jgi:hypothetical protein